jgi:hypothetical protein
MRLGHVAIALLLFATTACPQEQEQRTYVTHADGNALFDTYEPQRTAATPGNQNQLVNV